MRNHVMTYQSDEEHATFLSAFAQGFKGTFALMKSLMLVAKKLLML
ncbi:hypothetical protein [Robertkochia solimangrovi]|nr:hypothetical protein [Robertkochia solimangrovi]